MAVSFLKRDRKEYSMEDKLRDIDAIARKFPNVPLERIKGIYLKVFDEMDAGAKIKDFVPIFVKRKVIGILEGNSGRARYSFFKSMLDGGGTPPAFGDA